MSPSLVAVRKTHRIAIWLTPVRFHGPFSGSSRAGCTGAHTEGLCLPAMLGEISSQDTTPASAERSLVFHLNLVTLAGDEIQLPIELQEFDHFNEFENGVVENLPLIGMHSTFGCELEFVGMDTRKILVNPIWDTLQECNCFNLIVRQCFTQAEHKGQLRRRIKAISVPSDDTDRVLPHAFSHVADIRHVRAGMRTKGEAACKKGTITPIWG